MLTGALSRVTGKAHNGRLRDGGVRTLQVENEIQTAVMGVVLGYVRFCT